MLSVTRECGMQSITILRTVKRTHRLTLWTLHIDRESDPARRHGRTQSYPVARFAAWVRYAIKIQMDVRSELQMHTHKVQFSSVQG